MPVRWPPRLLTWILLPTLVACTTGPDPNPSPSVTSGAPVFDPATLTQQLEALPHHPGADLGKARLANGLLPPTNRWFSGLVFGTEPQPVFPLPLSFSLTDQGFAFGLPDVTTTEKTIMGSFHPAVTVDAGSGWVVTAYDEASVAMSDQDGRGTVRIAEGSPYVSYTTTRDATLTTAGITWRPSDGYATTAVNGVTYGVTGDGVTVSGSTIEAPAESTITWFVVPDDGDPAVLAQHAAPVHGTSAAYTVSDQATTSLTYTTDGEQPTVFAAMPHQRDMVDPNLDCSLGTWPSVYGTLSACAGTTLTWTAPLQEARAALDLSSLTADQRDELIQQLATDVAADPAYPADTYFGGKALYRDAQLWTIATALGADDAAETLRGRLVTTLDTWTDPTRCADEDSAFCFFYDTTNRGVIGNTPSFGSQEYNDHHFHYGYFLYAAGVLAADEPELAARWAPVMDTLAADIANAPASDALPQRRTFDVYASHSWASGTSPFADGNNQESSAEAVHAWAGLTLWARASGNTALEAEARWMQALEAQAARAYWTDFDTTDPVYAGFDHTISPLNFGGKRDYATWFSPEPAAALAILVIPASPSSGHLAGDSARIHENVAEATSTGGFDQTYGAYLLMYDTLAGDTDPSETVALARSLSDDAIDDGLTRTYVLAFLMSTR